MEIILYGNITIRLERKVKQQGVQNKFQIQRLRDKNKLKVYVNGHFLYTTTYTKDKEGFCNKMIRVYRDGTVEIQ